MSSDQVSVILQGLLKPFQFAVFDLPARNTFAQALRTPAGGLLIEVSLAQPSLETLLARLGKVTRNELGFPSVATDAGNEGTSGQVVAQALAMLAASAGCANVCRVRTGSSR
jgi:hypothetical protein